MTDMIDRLTDRLAALRTDKESSFTTLRSNEITLQALFKSQPKNRPRHDDAAKYTNEITKLENKRQTTSMSLQDEKGILKEIKKLSDGVRELKTFADHQASITRLKTDTVSLRASLQTKDAAITEVATMLVKLKLAKSLDCELADLTTLTVEVPKDQIGAVIGKGGKTLTALTKKHNVHADVNKSTSAVTLTGSPAALAAAESAVLDIAMQRDEVHAFPTLLVQAFARNRSLSLGPVQELSGCEHIGVVRGKNSIASKDGSANIKFSGRDTQILAALDHINGMNYTNAVMTLAKKELGLLIGKGGATIKEVEERNGVDIEIAKSESENVTIVGKVDDVQKCTNEIELLLSENEEVEEAVDFTSAHRNLMLDNNAAKIRQVQKETKTYCNFSKGTGDWKARRDATSELTIKGTQAQIALARKLIDEIIAEFEAAITTIAVDEHMLPAIVGKGGAAIKEIKNSSGAQIDIDWTQFKLKIFATPFGEEGSEERTAAEEKVALAVAAVKVIQDKNAVEVITVGPDLLPILLGAPGKATRSKIMDELKVKLEVIQESRDVRLRGEAEPLAAAKTTIDDFLRLHYTVSYEFAPEDSSLLMSGGADSVLKKLEKEHEIEVHTRRDANTVKLRGEQDNVEKALASLKVTLHGGEGVAVEDMAVEDSVRGMIIGPKGANIKSTQTEFDVFITVLSSSSTLRIRGSPENVSRCVKHLVVFIAEQKIVVTVSVEDEKHKKMMVRGSRLFKDILEIGVGPTLKGDSLKLRGFPTNVQEAKRRILEATTHHFEVNIELDKHHMGRLSGLESAVSARAPGRISVEERTINVAGTRKQVSDTLELIYGYFTFCLDGGYTTIDVDSPRALFEALTPGQLATISGECGVNLQLDYVTSRVCVRSKTGAKEDALGEAKKQIDAALSKWNATRTSIKVEEWALSILIGRGGEVINKIRDETKSNIQVDAKLNVISISGAGMEAAKTAIEELLAKAKKEQCFITLPEGANPMFVGKKGANLKKLEKESGAKFDMSTDGVLIKGEEEDLEKAKLLVYAWVEEYQKSNAITTIDIDPSLAGTIIGSKGETINAIQAESGATIKLGKEDGKVLLKGSDEAVSKARAMIEGIVKEEEDRRGERREEREKEDERRREEREKGDEENKQQNGGNTMSEKKAPEVAPAEEKKVVKNNYAAVPVGAGGGSAPSTSMSKTARKRLNKKEKESSVRETAEGRGMLDMLREGKGSGGGGSAMPPPPPGLGFTPNSAAVKKGTLRATSPVPPGFGDSLFSAKHERGVVGDAPEAGGVGGLGVNGGESSEEEEDAYFTSSSGINVRL